MAKSKKKESSNVGDKKKDVTIELIKDEPNSTPHQVLHDIIHKHYPHLEDAKIALFWKIGWKATADQGKVRLWAVKKASDTMRAMTKFDLLIYLNKDLWGINGWKPEHQNFVLDSACMEIAQDLDRDGRQRVDEHNRDLWRILKPTIQTFPLIVERHGFVTVELQRLAQAAQRYDDSQRPLFEYLDDQTPADDGVTKDEKTAA